MGGQISREKVGWRRDRESVRRSTTISVVELQGVSQGNSYSRSERLRLPTASLTMYIQKSPRAVAS